MQKKKQGISLIVLVITIIVMIILASAIIISLQNNGIINKASSAVKSYNEDEVSHMASLAWSEAYLNGARTQGEFETAVMTALQNGGVDTSKYLITVTTSGVKVKDRNTIWIQNGLNITKGNVTLEAGDLIQYNAGVQGYEGKWKVLGAEDGKLLIMSTADVEIMAIYGLEGGTYNNRTYEYGMLNVIPRLNEICEAYGEGTGAVGARSIKVEDIDKLTGYDKTTYGANEVYQYGNEVTYSWNTEEEGKIDYTSTNGTSGTLGETYSNGFNYIDFNTMTKVTAPVNGSGMPTLTSDCCYYWVGDTTLPTTSQKATEMLFGEGPDYENIKYMTISPFYRADGYYGGMYGLFYIDYGAVDSTYGMYYSDIYETEDGLDGGGDYGVRAVVELSPNIIIGQKDNTLGWSYTI